MSRIVIAGSLDTKAAPHRLLVELLRQRGEQPIVIDTSVFANEEAADYPAAEVAGRAGCEHGSLPPKGRAEAVRLMAAGAARILSDLLDRGEIGALVCMGGSNAATIFSLLAPVLPLGIPKILMATRVAGDVGPIVAGNDVTMLYPVVDIDGENFILSRMIERLADTATAVKSNRPFDGKRNASKSVALSMYGVTTPCVQRIASHIENAGLEALVFHANGTGGRSIEQFARQGLVGAIVDATLAEIGNEILGGAFPAGDDRLTGAAENGVPQVIAPGAIDMIAFGPRNTVPERFEDHNILTYNELSTLVRTTPDECRQIGISVGERLGKPSAPTSVCIPFGGTSMLDREGEAFQDPAAVKAFAEGLSRSADDSVRVLHSELNINEPEFADLMFEELQKITALQPAVETERTA